jgi:hypothetical protein
MSKVAKHRRREELLKILEQNWAHIRHMESLRMWSLNIYFLVVVGIVNAMVNLKYPRWSLGLIVGALLITLANLMIILKVEGVVEDYVNRNKKITDLLEISDYAGCRFSSGIYKIIIMKYIFPIFLIIMSILFSALLALNRSLFIK